MYVVWFTDGEDYDAVSVELVFNATVSRSCGEIPITDDPLVEPPESFNVTISTGDPPVILDPPTSIVTIVDNDGMLVIVSDQPFKISTYGGILA